MKKIASFIASPFSTEIIPLIGWSVEDAAQVLKRKFDLDFDIPSHNAAVAMSILTDKGYHYVVLFSRTKPNSIDGVGALVHESIHAASFVYEHAGATHDFANEEPYVYLAQRIFEACLEAAKCRK